MEIEEGIKQLLDSPNSESQMLGCSLIDTMGINRIDAIKYIINSNKGWMPYMCSSTSFNSHYLKEFLDIIFHIQIQSTFIAFRIEKNNGGVYLEDSFIIDDFHYNSVISDEIEPILMIVIESLIVNK